jgi:7-cyano-7-deazaguanine synthase
MKTVVLFSGGLDSTTLLYELAHLYGADQVVAISFDYGQRHRKELLCAKRIASKLGVYHHVVDINSAPSIFLGSSQTDESISVPEGHYEDSSMQITVVPNRNMIMLALAAAAAISHKASSICYAAHGGDHHIYFDCRLEFVDAMRQALKLCHDTPLILDAPYVNCSKAEIVKVGAHMGVPYEDTYSCYNGRELHCGACGTCTERKLSFEEAGVPDPTKYEDVLQCK